VQTRRLGVKPNPKSTASVANQIADRLRQCIASGLLQPGERLPSVPVLARESGTSTFPVAQAFQRLKREGLLVARPGAGTYVAPNLSDRRRVIRVMLHIPALNQVLGDFRAEHPQYTVIVDPFVSAGPDLDRLLGSPNPPDLIWFDSETFAHLAPTGRLSSIAAEIDVEGQEDTLVKTEKMFEFRRRRLGVALTITPFILAARKSIFAGADVPLPSPDWTGEEMLDLAVRLTMDRNGDGVPDQFGYVLTQRGYTWFALFRALGGSMRSWAAIASPQSRGAARRVWEAIHVRHISPPHIAGTSGQYGKVLMAAAETKRVAMLLTDLYSFRECRKRFGNDIVPLRSPRMPSGHRSSMAVCSGVGIPKGAVCREGAVALIRFLRSAKIQKTITNDYRVLPVHLGLWEEAVGGDEHLAWLLLQEMSAAQSINQSDAPAETAAVHREMERLMRGLILPEEFERIVDEQGGTL